MCEDLTNLSGSISLNIPLLFFLCVQNNVWKYLPSNHHVSIESSVSFTSFFLVLSSV